MKRYSIWIWNHPGICVSTAFAAVIGTLWLSGVLN